MTDIQKERKSIININEFGAIKAKGIFKNQKRDIIKGWIRSRNLAQRASVYKQK